jgi:hypothetical protein
MNMSFDDFLCLKRENSINRLLTSAGNSCEITMDVWMWFAVGCSSLFVISAFINSLPCYRRRKREKLQPSTSESIQVSGSFKENLNLKRFCPIAVNPTQFAVDVPSDFHVIQIDSSHANQAKKY